MKILFIGDIFGQPGLNYIKSNLKKIQLKYEIDFTIAQCENVSGRKGLIYNDYKTLLESGINAITMGNHVWAKASIFDFIDQAPEIIRPLNIEDEYPGQGTKLFKLKNGKKIRVTQFLGITFNELKKPYWKQTKANNFFDAFDQNFESKDADFHIIDFHGETTSEKNVFSLYLDGKIDAFIGTHTHIQTNDERILQKGTLYISDVGMVGPKDSAIGADYNSVYQMMRFNNFIKFKVSKNQVNFNAVILDFSKKRKIIKLNL